MEHLSVVRSSKNYREAGTPAVLRAAMGELIESVTKGGAFVDTGGLAPSKNGFRVRVRGPAHRVPGAAPRAEIQRERIRAMWVMVIVEATKNSEADVMPSA